MNSHFEQTKTLTDEPHEANPVGFASVGQGLPITGEVDSPLEVIMRTRNSSGQASQSGTEMWNKQI